MTEQLQIDNLQDQIYRKKKTITILSIMLFIFAALFIALLLKSIALQNQKHDYCILAYQAADLSDSQTELINTLYDYIRVEGIDLDLEYQDYLYWDNSECPALVLGFEGLGR